MAEYLAVEYNGLYNSNKQNTDYLDPPIIANVTSPTKPLTDEQNNAQNNADEQTQLALTAEQEASIAQTIATLAQTAVEDALIALSLASPQELATAQLAYDESVRLAQVAQASAQEAQTLAENARLLAEQAVTNATDILSFIDKLRFNTLECDINKPTNPLNFITEWSNAGSELYNFYGKNSLLTDDPLLLTTINTNGNLSTIGTLTNGSDDRIKSHEVNIENATETLLKLTPKIYDKHPSIRFHEDQEDNDLTNIPHFKESGLIAQEVLKDAIELEHLVVKPTTDDELYGMNYIGLIPYLIKSNQELYALLEVEKQKLEALSI